MEASGITGHIPRIKNLLVGFKAHSKDPDTSSQQKLQGPSPLHILLIFPPLAEAEQKDKSGNQSLGVSLQHFRSRDPYTAPAQPAHLGSIMTSDLT